ASRRLIRTIEVAFESVEVCQPEVSEGSKPGVDFLERFRLDSVKASLRVDARLHKPGLTEHPQVLGDRRLRNSEGTFNLADDPLGRCKQAQDGAAVGLRDNGKGRFHNRYIPILVYTCEVMPGCSSNEAADGYSSSLNWALSAP